MERGLEVHVRLLSQYIVSQRIRFEPMNMQQLDTFISLLGEGFAIFNEYAVLMTI